MHPSILLITNEYPPEKIAGTAVATRFLAEELVSRGHRVTVAVNTREHALPHEMSHALEVVRLRPARVPLTRMAQRAALLAAIARRVRPDVIQGQSLSCGFLAWLTGRALGIPSVVYVQGLDLYQSGAWARRTYIRWALTRCDRVATVTPDLQARALALSGRRGEVIPHGFRQEPSHELDRGTARSQLHLPADAKVLLFVGRLIAEKGVDHLLDAMPRVLSRCPDARLVVVGEGEERSRLMQRGRDLHLGEHVVFVGAQAHAEVIRYMRAADLFVLPSLVESFGIVLIEAMSCGLPIVASNIMGIPAVVEDGINGSLVTAGDAAALADGVVGALTDPAKSAGFAARNLQKAAGYAVPRIADRFLDLWRGAAVAGTHGLPAGDSAR
ncbi:MAG TPA: glycosyltransferase family 4 protein [bacterium]|nr:glycosyltransferase family 4 protein [bacterium]